MENGNERPDPKKLREAMRAEQEKEQEAAEEARKKALEDAEAIVAMLDAEDPVVKRGMEVFMRWLDAQVEDADVPVGHFIRTIVDKESGQPMRRVDAILAAETAAAGEALKGVRDLFERCRRAVEAENERQAEERREEGEE